MQQQDDNIKKVQQWLNWLLLDHYSTMEWCSIVAAKGLRKKKHSAWKFCYTMTMVLGRRKKLPEFSSSCSQVSFDWEFRNLLVTIKERVLEKKYSPCKFCVHHAKVPAASKRKQKKNTKENQDDHGVSCTTMRKCVFVFWFITVQPTKLIIAANCSTACRKQKTQWR